MTAGGGVWQALKRTTDARIEGLTARAGDDAGKGRGSCRGYLGTFYADPDRIVKPCEGEIARFA